MAAHHLPTTLNLLLVVTHSLLLLVVTHSPLLAGIHSLLLLVVIPNPLLAVILILLVATHSLATRSLLLQTVLMVATTNNRPHNLPQLAAINTSHHFLVHSLPLSLVLIVLPRLLQDTIIL